MMSEKKIGFIGAGNMATAIINGILKNKTKEPSQLSVFDLDKAKLELMAQKGINVKDSAVSLVKGCDIIVLAVKPQNYEEVLTEIKPFVTTAKTFVSIAAGISVAYITGVLQTECPVVRIMPNTPLLLGKGATAMCRPDNVADDVFDEVYSMFALSGEVVILPESKMNEIIAVNGSSPAYIYLFAKAMKEYAESVGIDGDTALSLICKTLEGSAEMLRSSGDTPEELIKKVSSKGGTTIAALDVLNANGFSKIIFDAMAACTNRAEELGR